MSAERDEVLTVLRKARRLASKLGVNDIDDWVRHELDGYNRGDDIAAYRSVTCDLVFKTVGYSPVGYGMIGTGVMDVPSFGTIQLPVDDPLANVMQWIASGNDKSRTVALGIPPDMQAKLSPFVKPTIANQVEVLSRANASQVQSIPGAVQDRVLDWALALERRGVLGGGRTFREGEHCRPLGGLQHPSWPAGPARSRPRCPCRFATARRRRRPTDAP